MIQYHIKKPFFTCSNDTNCLKIIKITTKKLLILNVIYIKISSFYFHLNNENAYLTTVLFVEIHDNLNAS